MKTVELGKVAAIDRQGIDPESLPGDVLYLGLEHIERGGRILSHSSVADAALASTKFRFTSDHVLFGKLRPNLGKVARPDFNGVCSTDILPIRPGNDLDRGFLAHYLSQPSMVKLAATRASGANLPRLSPKVLSQFPVPLPPLDEQRRIASILDHADALRAKRRQALAHLDSLTQSIFHDMFKEFRAVAIVDEVVAKEKGSIRTGPFGSQLLHSEFVADGVSVLGLDNVVSNEFRQTGQRFITPEKYEQLARYTVHPGDVLISIMGTTGRCVVVPEGLPTSINTKHICAITVDQSQVLPEFLRAAFLWHRDSLRHLRQQTKGSIMAGLNMGIIKNMPVPVPPMSLQRSFVEKTMSTRTHRHSVIEGIRASDDIFSSMQSRAFRGDL